MANKSISGLDDGAAVSDTDLLANVQTVGAGPVKTTALQLKTYLLGGGSAAITSAKTLTVSNSLTLAGTDGTTMTFPGTSGTVATLNANNLFTGVNTFQPGVDGQALTARRNGAGQTSNILEIQTEANATLAAFDKLGNLTITGNSVAVTTSQPVLNLSQTWNGAGVVFEGIKFSVTNTASNSTSSLFKLSVDNTSYFTVSRIGRVTAGGFSGPYGALDGGGSNGIALRSDAVLSWVPSTSLTATADLTLYRDAANTLALRNGAAAQSFNIYNIYTDGSNYERGYVSWRTNVFELGTEAATSANKRSIRISAPGDLLISTNNNARWKISNAGDILAETDNAYNIGASNATRPANIYIRGIYYSGPSGYALCDATSSVYGYFQSNASGVFRLTNSAGNDFARLCFGDYSATYPALKRSSATLQVRLADDSADAAFKCGTATGGGTALDVTGTGGASIMSVVNTTTGTLLDVINSSAASLFSVHDTNGATVSTVPLVITGNQSIAAFGGAAIANLAGVKIKGGGSTLTDTGTAGSGTVALGATNVLGGNTLAATNSSVTYTDYFSNFYKDPVAGTNITLTRKYSLGTEGAIRVNAGTSIPAAGAANTGIMLSSTAGFGVYFGSGAPTVSAAKGSLYLRSDGTTTNDRMYVNTDGGTTWTAVTTAA